MSSLDHLIDLAKRTGDRLIVHDPIEGRDVVIMDVQEYENMVIEKENIRHDVRSMSSRQMLDQINRDIAVWRANKQMEEQWGREEMLEKEAEEQGPFDPFSETDFHVPEWHSAGSVLHDRIKNEELRIKNNELSDWDSEDEEKIVAPNFVESDKLVIPDFDDEDEEEDVGPRHGAVVEDFKMPWDVEEEKEEKKPIRRIEHQDYFADGGNLKEEKLPDSDEPVFYEEPV